MEPLGVVSEESWSSFDATMSVEESEMMAQLLGTYPFLNENDRDQSLAVPSMFWSDHVADPYYSLDIVDPTLYCCPQGNSSNVSSFIAVPSDYESYYQSDSNLVPLVDASPAPLDYCISEEQISNQSLQVVPSNFLGDQFCLVEETSGNNSGDSSMTIQQSQPKRKFHAEEVNKPAHLQKDDIPTENPKKKARTPSNRSAKKAQKNTKPSDEDESNAAMNGQNPSCSSSEDNSNASQELNGGGEDISSSSKGSAALTSSGKTRAGRGSASDPQSLYARKRRERINERLRMLQTLVPNGTKVDISTMLEEAVHYVKFLQLQIKLLSSDDLWMYAPLAYNGMDIGLDLKISLPKQ